MHTKIGSVLEPEEVVVVVMPERRQASKLADNWEDILESSKKLLDELLVEELVKATVMVGSTNNIYCYC